MTPDSHALCYVKAAGYLQLYEEFAKVLIFKCAFFALLSSSVPFAGVNTTVDCSPKAVGGCKRYGRP